MIMGIDVAVKTFAYCVIDNNQIIDMNIINFLENNNICSATTKHNNKCSNNSKYKSNNNYYCGIHKPKSNYIILGKCSHILKSGKQCSHKTKFINNHCEYCNQHAPIDSVEYGRPIKEYSIDFLTGIIIKSLNLLKYKPTIINIENQPCLKNPLMKTIQIIITTYYKMNNSKINIIKADHKFKWLNLNTTCPKGDTEYDNRKNYSIDTCLNYLKQNNLNNWIQIIESFKKKDDICDAFHLAHSV